MSHDGPPPRAPRWVRRCLLITTLVLSLAISGSLAARAAYTATAVGTSGVTARRMSLVPTLSCGGLGLLSVNFTWTATADNTTNQSAYGSGFLADGYELAKGPHNGPYTTVVAQQTGLSKTLSITSGHSYYVVRTTKHGWRGPTSNEVDANGILFLAATCS
jgi:hypothetical protein